MDTTRLDLNLLATLEALLLEQNVTKAASRLHLSQPAVSAQLSRLRAIFDDPLLIPARRGMTPTVKALELLPPLRAALNQVRTTLASHRDFDPAQAELTLGIAATDYLQAVVIMPLVIRLRREAPGMRIAIHNLDPQQLAKQMEGGTLDLALLSPKCAPPGLHARHLFDERYVLVGRRDHPQLRAGISLEEYARLEHVVVSLDGGGFATPVDDALQSSGYRRRVVLSAASFLLVPEILARSDFVALLPERLVCEHGDSLRQIEMPSLADDFAVGMVWHERTHGHPGQRWLRDVIAAMVGMS
jgi:DNA-binding transcriptional LysR family regulator